MRNKILSLLVLLLTAASGAWAEEKSETILTYTGQEVYTGEHFKITPNVQNNNLWVADLRTYQGGQEFFSVETLDGQNISKLDLQINYIEDTSIDNLSLSSGTKSYDSNTKVLTITNVNAAIVQITLTEGDQFGYVTIFSVTYYYEESSGPEVTWNASTKTGTFSMPGSDVVLTPQYAPTAKWDVVENVEQKPAALEGIIAGQDAAIVTAGQSAQGTVMYAVTTTAEAAPALTAFSATVPTAKTYDDATTVYVWYYIQGQDTPDGQQATEENTFNDSEISAAPLKVDILTNKFDLTLSPAPVKNMTVTVAGQAKTPTDEGKVTGVKMESEVKVKAADGYKFRKVEVKKGGAAVTALAPALENGATVVIICNWGYDTTTFTYTNNGGTFSGQASGYDADYFHNGLELNGKNLSFGASNMDNSEYLSVGITFNTESSAYSYTGKGEDFVSFTISVNGTDVTDQLSELK